MNFFYGLLAKDSQFSAVTYNHLSITGQRFAMMEQKVVLAHVVMNYEIKSLVPRDQLQLTAEMVLRSHNGIVLQITPRRRIGEESIDNVQIKSI